ncbi:hypothetical protein [Halopseudomonas xiamenensis]|uniref:hypothetical protein n=1 Tax=Halopseudomonas xiamenensis TaxID=157792 RepID=UPI001627737F|nr:hypothetical protein [Halopseudomonas xiamenensis]
MKTVALIFTTALLASPAVFAQGQDATCEANMQALSDNSTLDRDGLSDAARQQVDEHVRLAGEAQAQGDDEACVVHSSKALQELRGAGSANGEDADDMQ